jgi:hypothetical protein
MTDLLVFWRSNQRANHVAEKAIPDMMRVLFGVLVFGVLRSCDAGFARF